MKFGILQIVVVLVLIIFLLVAVVKPSQKFTSNSRIGRFGNIMASDGTTIRINSQTINNVEFKLTYTTPAFYTQSAATDNIATQAQKQFKPKPLLFLIDTTTCPVLLGRQFNAIEKAITLNSFPNFTKIKLTNILNIPNSSTTTVQTSPVAGGFVTGSPGVALASDIKNLINPAAVLTSSSITITGNSTTTSQEVTCTIAASVDIVTTPLVIGRTYALGLSLMNGVDLPTTDTAGVWQGIKLDGSAAGITTKYSPMLWAGFTITDDIINISDVNGIPTSVSIITLNYTTLQVG